MAKELLYKYVLTLGDDALILGQRLSQWAYKGPFLEEDFARSNISLDREQLFSSLIKSAS